MLRAFLRAPVQWGISAVVFAASVALIVWWVVVRDLGFGSGCEGPTTSGKHLVLALGLVGYGGIVEVALILSTRRRERLLAAALLLGAIGLSVALDLVALDKATYLVRWNKNSPASPVDCGPHHAGYLYVLWGLPLAVLLLQGLGVLLSGRHPKGSNE